MAYKDSPAAAANEAAARLGCGICGGAIRLSPNASDPFSEGPYRGRYWCADCWTLYWHEHPEHLADAASKRYVSEQATRIKKDRGWELLFEEGENRAYLTERGTLIINLMPMEGFGVGEYHPEQFQALIKALHEIDKKNIYGFTLAPAPAEEPKA